MTLVMFCVFLIVKSFSGGGKARGWSKAYKGTIKIHVVVEFADFSQSYTMYVVPSSLVI